MSAFSSPNPAPLETPQKLAPQAVPPAPPARTPGKAWIWLVGIVVISGLAYWAMKSNRAKPATQETIRTTRVTRGPLTKILRVAGVTGAHNFNQVVAPVMRGGNEGRSLVLMKLVPSGAHVKKGELIAQIDGQAYRDHIDDLTALIQQANADVKKRQAEHAIEMEDLQQMVRAAAAAVEKAKLDRNATEIRSVIDQEILQLAVEEAEAQHKQLQGDIATTRQKQAAEIRILEYTRDRHTRHHDRHQHDWEKLTIYASMSGLAVMQSIWRGGEMGQVQEGDQVYPGQPFMKIVDTSSMQLEGNVNQVESEGVRLGQPAELSFDAFPGMHLKGKVVSVGALGVAGWQQNYYLRQIPVRIAIEGQDARLIPDLSASGDVLLDRKDDAVIAPLEAITAENGKTLAYVRDGAGFAAREVQLGERNNNDVAVLAGLNAGDEVALSRPATLEP